MHALSYQDSVFLPVLLLAMIMAADKQRSPVMSKLAEAMMTGMMILIVLIGHVCSGAIVDSQVQARGGGSPEILGDTIT